MRRRRQEERKAPLRIGAIARRVAEGYRDDWKVVLVAGLIVFVPIDLIGAFDLIGDRDLSTIGTGTWVAEGALVLAQLVLPMLGNVFYAGIVASGEAERRYGDDRNFMSIARELPYVTLAIADVLVVAAVVLGFALLIVPGIVAMVVLSQVAPVVEIERTGPVKAFRRSWELIRGRFWQVARIILPLIVLQGLLNAIGDDIGHRIFGAGFAGDWIGTVVANLLSSALWALTILAIYLELRKLQRDSDELPV